MTLISNLQTGAEIGSGYFGKVHEGTDDVHGKVAVKIFTRKPSEADADWQERKKGLLAEGQRLSRAEHTNVLKVHGLLESQTSDAVHLVMDYCPGGCLQKKFEAGPMALADARRYATHVTMGLAALHARGMIHRDIKPGNILLNKHGAAQLGDFGLVTDNIIVAYASGQGYSDHLPPEVLNGGGTSVKSDVWALGMTIYRLLHGAEWYSRLPKPRHVAGRGGFAKHLPFLPDKVSWTCLHKNRKYFVEWEMVGADLYNWSAWSEPTGKGNRRSFGSSNGVSYDTADRELVATFAKIG
ncbi:serine/threonine-protein kinase [Bradyrhizobium sp. WSM1253]|uniref:serine/threonine-protein kinase n=1 Tax=Bradyrhizobium sp. WSM1253 TaxID=319003 RepID=UPI00025D1865|nr:serine/threonine-protein kinase [Bradyrhizobium sp. WSM1253]EIG56104.1 protein kinase family protein [Bradyrhizobium sp. WSM1253]